MRHRVTNFEKLYTRAQMELERVLGLQEQLQISEDVIWSSAIANDMLSDYVQSQKSKLEKTIKHVCRCPTSKNMLRKYIDLQIDLSRSSELVGENMDIMVQCFETVLHAEHVFGAVGHRTPATGYCVFSSLIF